MTEIGTQVEILTGLNRGHHGTVVDIVPNTETGGSIYVVRIDPNRRNHLRRTVHCTSVRVL